MENVFHTMSIVSDATGIKDIRSRMESLPSFFLHSFLSDPRLSQFRLHFELLFHNFLRLCLWRFGCCNDHCQRKFTWILHEAVSPHADACGRVMFPSLLSIAEQVGISIFDRTTGLGKGKHGIKTWGVTLLRSFSLEYLYWGMNPLTLTSYRFDNTTNVLREQWIWQ